MPETAIKVAIRVRPSSLSESMIDEFKINQEGTIIEVKNTSFLFDTVFGPETSNEDVYKRLVFEKIQHLFDGFNVTILAYGSTGSGKTFTMGTASNLQEDSLGLIPLGLKQIFDHVHSISQETDVAIKASFFEIYMENVKDLLKSQSTFVPGDSKEAKISNMSQVSVKSYNEAIQTLKKGCQTRTTAVTAKNAKSSRSHAFFLISMIMTDRKTRKSKFAKFQLVDLAGSERAGTDTSGKELKQGIQINKGLTALGRVISSLSKREKHIPYRDSILTRYLQESLGGSSYTVMVTCVSPAHSNLEETLSSLRYSSFAKNIKNNAIINRDSTDVIEQLKAEAQSNRKKIKDKLLELSTTIQSLEEKMSSETSGKPLLQPYIDIVGNIKQDLNSFIKNLSNKSDIEYEEKCKEAEELKKNLSNKSNVEYEEKCKEAEELMKSQNLSNKSDIEYEEKCKEAEELKKKLHDAEEKIQQLSSELTLPSSSAGRIRSKSKKSDEPDPSMIEAYLCLSEDETSFTQESESRDPDYRATPMWKRNRFKAKRKNPEDPEVLSSPKVSKAQDSFHH